MLNTKRGVEKVGLAETCTIAATVCYRKYSIFIIRTMKWQSILNCVFDTYSLYFISLTHVHVLLWTNQTKTESKFVSPNQMRLRSIYRDRK